MSSKLLYMSNPDSASNLMLLPSLACLAWRSHCFGPHAGGESMTQENLEAFVRWQRHTGNDAYQQITVDRNQGSCISALRALYGGIAEPELTATTSMSRHPTVRRCTHIGSASWAWHWMCWRSGLGHSSPRDCLSQGVTLMTSRILKRR